GGRAAMTFQEILDRFGARKSGSSYKALCPVHAENTASLDIRLNRAGTKVLLYDHGGHCSVKSILDAVGLTAADLRLNGEPPRRERNNAQRTNKKPEREKAAAKSAKIPQNVVAVYNYPDEAGELLFQVLRYKEPGKPKDFLQRRPDGKGGWIWNLDGVRRVPYRLADFLPKPSVLIVEGEKDVKRARRMGLVATCNPHGAGKWRDE